MVVRVARECVRGEKQAGVLADEHRALSTERRARAEARAVVFSGHANVLDLRLVADALDEWREPAVGKARRDLDARTEERAGDALGIRLAVAAHDALRPVGPVAK